MVHEIGNAIHSLATRLFPICRSLTGQGVRDSISILQEIVPNLRRIAVESGEQCFDWVVPDEWNVTDAYIKDPTGKRIVDFQECNLHVLGYSLPVHETMSLEALQDHLYSIPEQPDAIPYITSYYKKRWGFCLTQRLRDQMQPGQYEVKIDSQLKPGHLHYAELIIPGRSEQEIFLSTYLCHPSLANDNLSGPCTLAYLAKHIREQDNFYTYRLAFVPETIGAIVYLNKHLTELKRKVVAGLVMTCMGDEGKLSYLPSRAGNTLTDRAARHVLRYVEPDFVEHSFLDRGSDERQYCSPGVDLPMGSIMRTKYGLYPEYHTSLDNLTLITPSALQHTYEALVKFIECIEHNEVLTTSVYGEPQLGKRGLYPNLSTKQSNKIVRNLRNLIAYADGHADLIKIADEISVPVWELTESVAALKKEKLLHTDVQAVALCGS